MPPTRPLLRFERAESLLKASEESLLSLRSARTFKVVYVRARYQLEHSFLEQRVQLVIRL